MARCRTAADRASPARRLGGGTRLRGVTGEASAEAKTGLLAFATLMRDSRKADYGARKGCEVAFR